MHSVSISSALVLFRIYGSLVRRGIGLQCQGHSVQFVWTHCTRYWQPVISSVVDRTMMQGTMRGMLHWWLFVSCSGLGGAYGMKHWDGPSALGHERLKWVQSFQRGTGHRPFRISQKGIWAPSPSQRSTCILGTRLRVMIAEIPKTLKMLVMRIM
jgi:hypothetical protein